MLVFPVKKKSVPSMDAEGKIEDAGQNESENSISPYFLPSTTPSIDPEGQTEESGQTRSDSRSTPFIPEKGFYQPSTEETREAYQALLSIIQYQIGERSQSIICVIADEILSVLTGPKLPSPNAQKAEIEKLLKPIDNEIFDLLILVAENMTDYYHVTSPAEKGFYQPRSEDTWIAYGLLLDVIESQVGNQSLMDRCEVAHLILLALKDDGSDECDGGKKRKVEQYLDLIPDETFELLVAIEKQIWDFDEFKIRAETWESSQRVVVDDGGHGVEGFERLRICDHQEEERERGVTKSQSIG